MAKIRDIKQFFITKKIIKPFSIYAGANFVNQAIPFFLLPVLTRVLTPSDYGMVATFTAVMGITNVLVSLGVNEAVMRAYFDTEKKGFIFSQYIFNAAFINFIAFIKLTFAVFFIKIFLSQKLAIPMYWLFAIPFISFCACIYSMPVKLFIFKQKPIPYAIFNTANTIGEFGLSIFFIVLLGLGWQGRVMGIAINQILFFIISVYILFKSYSLDLTFNYTYIKQILSYGAPTVLHSLGIVTVAATDKFFLNRFVGLTSTGVYSAGSSVSSIIVFFVGAFSLAWGPIFYEMLNRITEELKVKLVKLTYLYFIAIVFVSLVFTIVAPYFLKFFVGKNFQGTSKFIFWFALSYAAYGLYTMVSGYIFYTKKTYYLSVIAVVTVIFNLIFNYVLIKSNGAIGAAQATFLTFFSRFILVWYFSNKVYPMPWFSFLRRKGNVV